jgi:copper chaperone CopZ
MTSNDSSAVTPADPTRRVLIRVRGMDGPRCAASVASALSLINGVSDVAVSLNDGRAELNLDPRKAEAEQLRTAVAAVGFEAHLFFEEFSDADLAGGQAAA